MSLSYDFPHTGMEVVDGQLKALLYHLRRFPTTGAARGLIEVALCRLEELWMEHCKTEEALMVKHSYLEQQRHYEEHQRISSEIKAAQELFNNGKDISLEMGVMLREWIIDHILILDMPLADWIARHSGAGFQESV